MPIMSTPQFESIFSDVTLVRYFAVSTLVILLYDYFLTLEREIRFIWLQKSSICHLPFLLNRYTPFFYNGTIAYYVLVEQSSSRCKSGIFLHAAFAMVGLLSAQATFLLRADAIWGRQRFVRGLLAVTFLVTSAVFIYLSTEYVASVHVFSEKDFPSSCLYYFEKKNWGLLIMIMMCDLFAFILLLVKNKTDAILASTALMQAVHRESLKCFCVLTAFTFSNLIIQLVVKAVWRESLIATESVLINMFCARMLLAIRGAIAREDLWDDDSGESFHFADHCLDSVDSNNSA